MKRVFRVVAENIVGGNVMTESELADLLIPAGRCRMFWVEDITDKEKKLEATIKVDSGLLVDEITRLRDDIIWLRSELAKHPVVPIVISPCPHEPAPYVYSYDRPQREITC